MIKNILSIFAVSLLFVSCSWLKDDLSSCPECDPGLWLKFTHKYNMEKVDKASEMVNELKVRVVNNDKQNVVWEKTLTREELEPDMSVKITGLDAGNYSVLAWGGLADNRYVAADGTVTLNEPYQTVTPLTTLFYGADSFKYTNPFEDVTKEIDLMNDVNTVNIDLMEAKGEDLKSKDFLVKIGYDDTKMSYETNDVISTGNKFTYKPFAHADYPGDGVLYKGAYVRSSFSILRLLENDQTNNVEVWHPASNYRIANINLTNYLLLALSSAYKNMGKQEYLDRENTFNVIMLLEATGDEDRPYIMLKVNDWIVRPDDAIIE